MNGQTFLPVVFLDIDDVVCMSSPYGGFDAIEAVAGRHYNPNAVYRELFVKRSRDALKRVHDEFGGQLHYVISSTWREVFEREQLSDVFRRGGLGFVAERLHDESRWCTPLKVRCGRRIDEIAQWLDQFSQGEPFVIIDDTYSGPSLQPALTVASHPFAGRVVLCKENIGLNEEHVQPIVDALRRPVVPPESPERGDAE